MAVQVDFMSHDKDEVLWLYEYETKTFVHKDTGEKFAFRFDPDTSIFTTSKGVELTINPMSKFTLADFQHKYKKKHEPLPPKIKVKIDENEYIEETNENDVGWKLAYARFTENASMELLKFLIIFSIDAHVPPDSYERLTRMARAMGDDVEYDMDGDNSAWDENITYLFIRDSIGDEQELYAFFDVLMGRNLITKAALVRSEERFPNEDSGA